MERTEAFEKMLSDIVSQYEYEKAKMDELRSQGKEKTATYKQYMGNRMVYGRIIALYREYGLIE